MRGCKFAETQFLPQSYTTFTVLQDLASGIPTHIQGYKTHTDTDTHIGPTFDCRGRKLMNTSYQNEQSHNTESVSNCNYICKQTFKRCRCVLWDFKIYLCWHSWLQSKLESLPYNIKYTIKELHTTVHILESRIPLWKLLNYSIM